MATYRQQFLSVLADNERALAAAMDELAAQVAGAITQAADFNTEQVPPARQNELLQRITRLIIAFYLVSPSLTALHIAQNGTVTPLSPFMRLLWPTMQRTAALAAAQQAAYLRRQFADMPDVLARLSTPRYSFDSPEAVKAASAQGALFLAGFAPPHLYERSDGRVLEERIRLAAIDHSSRTTSLLRERLSAGVKIGALALLLRRFFEPGGSVDGATGVARATAISRTEPVFSWGLAQRVGAIFNPFVKQAVVRRSSEGAKPCSVCDPLVGVYPADNYPVPGFHPNCVCRVDFITTRDAEQARKRMIGTGAINVEGPLSPTFVDAVMGRKSP